MSPNVRRSWAPRGQTPILKTRTRSHRKASAIAALAVSPKYHRVRLLFQILPNNVNADATVRFLKGMNRHLCTRVTLLWDRLRVHRSKKVSAYLKTVPRISVHYFPPYAPELDPVENVWSWLKMNPMANYAPREFDELVCAARRNGRSLQKKPKLLKSFLIETPLFFSRE